MPALDEIRKRKLEELMRQQQKSAEQPSEQEQVRQQIEMMESVVRQFLAKDALERYGNLKAAHKEKALQLLAVIYSAIKKGHDQQIDDNLLKKIIEQITPKKRDIKIKRV